jgi:hypothetical protein
MQRVDAVSDLESALDEIGQLFNLASLIIVHRCE